MYIPRIDTQHVFDLVNRDKISKILKTFHAKKTCTSEGPRQGENSGNKNITNRCWPVGDSRKSAILFYLS